MREQLGDDEVDEVLNPDSYDPVKVQENVAALIVAAGGSIG